MTTAKKNSNSIHYVDNNKFSLAVLDYVSICIIATESEKSLPIVPDYIAVCFLKICEGLSHKANFVRYTYREEMVMDGVENCLSAVKNYNIEAATRTGKPNAFAYFTQIAWYAFIRRIQKEKKQQDIKMKYIKEMGIEGFLDDGGANVENIAGVNAFVDVLRGRIDTVRHIDSQVKTYAKVQRKKRRPHVDSDLSGFIDE
jgi:hypothetical protein|tara:strand:- start:3024 stop:3623 length:600 start_codon:yes stop_codon:yes gene_type:complete